MEMHQVRYFLSMAKLLNFTRAAAECNVSQPSLTRAIQKLEEEFGGALFRRERNLSHLTDLGRLMLPHLQTTFDAAQAAKQLAKGVGSAQVAPLALGVDASIDTEWLTEILAELGKGLPGFELNLVTGRAHDLTETALNGQLDLVVIEVPDELPARIETWSLFGQSYYMVTRADHPLASLETRVFSDATEEHWIDHDGRGCLHLKSLAADRGFEPSVRHRASSAEHVKRLIIAGLGSAFMPRPRDHSEISAFKFEDVDIIREVALGAVSGRQRGVATDAFVRASRARNWSSFAG